jgi:hypothetical protein
MQASSGSSRIRAALARLLPSQPADAAGRCVELFGRELDDYAELIVGPGQRPAGFMTRGEDAGFTERAGGALAQLGMGDEALAHHRRVAEWFEHVRAFLKLEWHVTDAGVEPLAACYFRRRPTVDEVLTRLGRWGVGAAARELTMDVARLLEKDSVHFVAAAFRPESAVHHKLYFSQYLTAETQERVADRITRVFRLFGRPEAAIERWRTNHDRTVRLDESTIFLSVSFTADRIAPSFKIDYPEVVPARAAVWVGETEQAGVMGDCEAASALVGSAAVSYLGVRFADAGSSLKYYCDVPSPGQ